MTKYLKLIWFAEETWTKYHAAVGINAKETFCRLLRSTRSILPSERLDYIVPRPEYRKVQCCRKCLAILNSKYGQEHVDKVKVA